MFIINQDRDQFIQFGMPGDSEKLFVKPAIYKGNLYGFNLCFGQHMLGTFDSVRECIDEITLILKCTSETYAISGYSEWKTWEDIIQIMTGGGEND